MLNACFGGVSAKKEVHTPSGFHYIFAAIAACSMYECFTSCFAPVKPGIRPLFSTFGSRFEQKYIIAIIAIKAIIRIIVFVIIAIMQIIVPHCNNDNNKPGMS